MILQPIQLELDLWEAWVEFDAQSLDSFGTLYIMGEAMATKDGRSPVLLKSKYQEKGKLVLNLEAGETGSYYRLKEVIHAEPISSLNAIECIVIYHLGELVAEITDIEVLV